MTIRYLADADLNHRLVRAIVRREPAIDMMGARDGGTIGLPDPEVLRIAAAESRILVSHDRRTMPRHFQRFLRESDSSGLIIVPQGLELAAAVEDLVLIWAASVADEWRNRIGYLPI